MVKLTNVPCVIVTIKCYIGCDMVNEGEEGVTVQIKLLSEGMATRNWVSRRRFF
jgi:hypothetical protein